MISNSFYVDIITNYKGNTSKQRSYHARIFAQNAILPTNSVIPFYNLASVGEFFGTASLEYLQAQRYFAYVSPVGKSPNLMEFFKYSPAGANAFIFSDSLTNKNLAEIQAISNGSLTLSFNGVATELTALNFTGALTWEHVATILQTAWTVAKGNIVFNAVRNSLVITTATEGISTIEGIAGDASLLLNLGLITPILSLGSGIQTITQCFNSSVSISDSFGGYTFNGISLDENIIEASDLANSPRADYLYSFELTTDTFEVLELIKTNEGTCPNFDNLEQNTSICPLAIFASTDYTAENGVQGYMFRVFAGMVPVVSGDTKAIELNNKKVNFYGITSRNGYRFMFYQNGFCTGTAQYLEVYTGSIHLKQVIVQALLDLEIQSMLLPVGPEGEGIVRGLVSAKASTATTVGIIKGRNLSEEEENSIVTDFGSDCLSALRSSAYWIKTESVGTTIKYILVYISVVGVRKIEGTHTVTGV